MVLLADFAKGAAAAGIGWAAGGRPGAYSLGCAAVVGHTYPFRRKGGKGVAAAGGMLVVLFPLEVVALGVVWVARRPGAAQGLDRVAADHGGVPRDGRGSRATTRGRSR